MRSRPGVYPRTSHARASDRDTSVHALAQHLLSCRAPRRAGIRSSAKDLPTSTQQREFTRLLESDLLGDRSVTNAPLHPYRRCLKMSYDPRGDGKPFFGGGGGDGGDGQPPRVRRSKLLACGRFVMNFFFFFLVSCSCSLSPQPVSTTLTFTTLTFTTLTLTPSSSSVRRTPSPCPAPASLPRRLPSFDLRSPSTWRGWPGSILTATCLAPMS